MNNKENKINIKIFRLISYIALLLPVLIVIRYILGYRVIIFIDLFLTIVLYVFLSIFWIQKKKKYGIYKAAIIIFIIILGSGVFLPGLEYLGFHKTLYADLLYIVPSLIYIVFYIYYCNKGYVDLSD